MINRSVDLSEEYYLGGMLESIEISLINILFRSYYWTKNFKLTKSVLES